MLVPIQELPPQTRVWIYAATQPFTEEQTRDVRGLLLRFVDQWTSHNHQLRGSADILHNRFLLLFVDESTAGASGCSIDASVRFMKQLEEHYGVDLFNRLYFTFSQGKEIRTVSRDEFEQLYAAGSITDETPVFDTLVATKGDLERGFIKPLAESWHKRMI